MLEESASQRPEWHERLCHQRHMTWRNRCLRSRDAGLVIGLPRVERCRLHRCAFESEADSAQILNDIRCSDSGSTSLRSPWTILNGAFPKPTLGPQRLGSRRRLHGEGDAGLDDAEAQLRQRPVPPAAHEPVVRQYVTLLMFLRLFIPPRPDLCMMHATNQPQNISTRLRPIERVEGHRRAFRATVLFGTNMRPMLCDVSPTNPDAYMSSTLRTSPKAVSCT